MKKILLLGDSIRLSYGTKVKKMLSDFAIVDGPTDNCRFVKYTLWNLQEWLQTYGTPDIIHWNNGIWDIYHLNKDIGIFTPLDEYLKDIKRVLAELRKTDAKIIWVSTTPVADANENCRNEDINRYNLAVKQIMERENIAINDLNSVIAKDISAYISEDHLHLSEKGEDEASKAVADFLRG